MIRFRNLKIEGFGSIGQAELNFNDSGITMIKGDNGAGKSSLINPLVWALYGNLLKAGSSIETWEHTRPEDYKGVKVELTLLDSNDKEHTIIRCKNYSGKVNGTQGSNRLILSSSNKNKTKEVQDEIDNLLNNIPLELFTQSIIFGQKIKSLVEEKGASKKKLLEHCLNLDFLQEALDKIKIDNQDLEKLKIQSNGELVKLENQLSDINHKIKYQEIDYQNALNLFNSKKELYEKTLKNLSEPRDIPKDLIKKEKDLKDKLDKIPFLQISENLTKDKNRLLKSKEVKKETEKFIFSKQNELNLLSSGSICEVCGVDKSTFNQKQIDEINKILKVYQKDLKRENDNIKALDIEISSLDSKVESYRQLENELKKLEYEKKSYSVDNSKEIKRIEKEILDLKEPIKPNIDSLTEKKKSLKTEIKKLSKTIKKYKTKEKVNNWLLKEPLSNKGLKSYIFDNYLMKQINGYISRYTNDLDFSVEFSIDHESGNKDVVVEIYKYSVPVAYEDLSGGQKQIINVITLLALHDLVMDSNRFNILVLDEIFESLDVKNIEVVLGLLEKKATNNEVIIITHHQAFNPINAKVVNTILDENGLTKIN